MKGTELLFSLVDGVAGKWMCTHYGMEDSWICLMTFVQDQIY